MAKSIMEEGKGGKGEVEAQTYVWVAGEQRLEPQEWDFDHFVKEKMGRWVGKEAEDEGFKGMVFGFLWTCWFAGCEGFLTDDADVDDAVDAMQDPTGGRGLNGDIARQLETGGKEAEKALGSAV